MRYFRVVAPLALFGVLSCGSSPGGSGSGERDVPAALDGGLSSSGQALSYMDVADGAVCLEWRAPDAETIRNAPIQPLNPCMCWGPPYCWCSWVGLAETYGCDDASGTCCLFMSTCVPCGWTASSSLPPEVLAEDYENPPECKPILEDMRRPISDFEWLQCVAWGTASP